MLSRTITGVTEDQALPALPRALDADMMLPFLIQAAGLQPDEAQGLACSAEVFNHKLGQRCTIRYTLVPPGDFRGLIRPLVVIGKLYRRRRLAARIYSWIQGLRNGVFHGRGPLGMPAPLMLIPDLGLILQEYAEGVDLRHALIAGKSEGPLLLAVQWLAKLHTAPLIAGPKVMSIQHELEKADRWCAETALHLPSTEGKRLRRAQDTLHRLAGALPPYTPVMIHKDFYYANVLWDGQRLEVLDFDQLSIGDQALDVGHFLGHLENLAYRTKGRADAFAEPVSFFAKSYLERTSLSLRCRLPFYKAYTFLKLAATEVSRKRGEWRQVAQVLTDLACQEAEEFGI